jgi:hypothetical protein
MAAIVRCVASFVETLLSLLTNEFQVFATAWTRKIDKSEGGRGRGGGREREGDNDLHVRYLRDGERNTHLRDVTGRKEKVGYLAGKMRK